MFKTFFCLVSSVKKIAEIHDNNIIRIISLFQETIQYPRLKPETISLSLKVPYTWNIKIFEKIEKNFEFFSKITKTEVIKFNQKLINSTNYAAAFY